jgi:hypothetical protein
MSHLYATLAIIGLMCTASDGIWFPALNCLGCLLFAVSLYFGEKQLERSSHGR